MGPVEEVCAFAGSACHAGIDVEDNAVAAVRFASGAVGAIQGSTAVWPGFLKRVEVSGMDGSAIMEEEDLPFWKFRTETAEDDAIRDRFAAATGTGGGAADPAAIGYHGHKMQFLDVIGAIERGATPAIDGREAAKAVAVIEAIYRSAESGRPEKVEEL
jgi:predicted dehydrogenase